MLFEVEFRVLNRGIDLHALQRNRDRVPRIYPFVC